MCLRISRLLLALLWIPTAFAEDSLPQRWVSAGSALTEWIVALGGQDKLAGVDSTSQYPETLRALPSIGYQRQLSAEGVLSLRADILAGTEEMGPPPVLSQLKAAGVRVETFSAQPTLPALQDNLLRLGKLLDKNSEAKQQLVDYEDKLARLQMQIERAHAKGQPAPRVLLLLSHAGTRPMAAGKDTAADWLIAQAGGENLATHTGYKAISSEALLAMNPDVLIFTDRSTLSAEGVQELLASDAALSSSSAAKNGRVISLDPTLLVGGLGPRLPDELLRLYPLFYPAAL